jgi:prolyl-tRNA editing enzyme YbaK/EbsC (Cys-tRNA(Pro) deacylase)
VPKQSRTRCDSQMILIHQYSPAIRAQTLVFQAAASHVRGDRNGIFLAVISADKELDFKALENPAAKVTRLRILP